MTYRSNRVTMKGEGASTSKLTSAAVLFMLMLCCRSATSAAIHQSVEKSSFSSPLSSPTNPTERTTRLTLDCKYALGHTLVSCIDDIISSLFHWSLKLIRPCCDAMAEAGYNCLNDTEPFTAFKVDDYKNYCYRAYGIKSASTTATATLQLDQEQQLPETAHQDDDQAVLLPSPSTAPAPIVGQDSSSSSPLSSPTDPTERTTELVIDCGYVIAHAFGPCVDDIIYSIFHWSLTLDRPCCDAMSVAGFNCLKVTHPFTSYTVDDYKKYCREHYGIITPSTTATATLQLDQ